MSGLYKSSNSIINMNRKKLKELPKVPMPKEEAHKTPSQSPFPVFALCQPLFIDNGIKNNPWMRDSKDGEGEIDKEEFMGEWYNLYRVLSFNALVYLIPAKPGLQDQTYTNCAAYLPHVKPDTIILSNFTAEGRSGEEVVAGEFFKALGYTVVKSPFKWEGEPELKFVKDNIYIGGYGIRTDKKALDWISEEFEAEIIPVKETDEKLYHLDCTVFRIDKENFLVCTDLIDKSTVKEIEKVTNVIPVSKEEAYQGICNSLQVGEYVLNSSSLQFMQKRDPEYKKEGHKDSRLGEICNKLGYEVVFLELSEAAKSGAFLSCYAMHLSYSDASK